MENVFSDKRDGFFVEAGAFDGIAFSNTWRFVPHGWQGILIEPTRVFEQLVVNRPESTCLPACLTQHDCEQVKFAEKVQSLPMSGLVLHLPNHAKGQKKRNITTRTGVSLGTLLDAHGAPPHIDYLSLDTEGSEVEILKGVPFDRYTFGAVSVELNGHDDELAELLGHYGYQLAVVLEHDGVYIPSGAIEECDD